MKCVNVEVVFVPVDPLPVTFALQCSLILVLVTHR